MEVDLAIGVVYGTLRVFGSFCMVVALTAREAGFSSPGGESGKRSG